MFINEDYFNDIDINADDIKANDITDSNNSHIPQEQDVVALNQYLTAHYRHSIVLSTCYIPRIKEEPNLRFWNSALPKMLKRVEYIFDLYNIEYEYVIRDDSDGCTNMKYHNIKNYHILSSYKTPIGASFNIYFYINFPNFNYKESYYFVERMYNAIQKKSDFFRWMMFSKKPLSLCKEFIQTKEIAFSVSDLDGIRIVKELPYKTFFRQAIYFFHNNSGDKMKINKMYEKIEAGIDPFA